MALMMGHLFDPRSRFAEVADDYREDVVVALAPLIEDSDDSVRTAALVALQMIGETGRSFHHDAEAERNLGGSRVPYRHDL